MTDAGAGNDGGATPPPPVPPGAGVGGGASRGNGRGPLLALLGALIVVVIAAAAFVVLTRDDKNNVNNTTAKPSAKGSKSKTRVSDTASSESSGSTDSATASSDDTRPVNTDPASVGNAFGDGGIPTKVIANGDAGFLATGYVSKDGKSTDRGGLWSGPADGSDLKRVGNGSAIEAPGLTVKDVAVRGDRSVAIGVNESGGSFGRATLLSADRGLSKWRPDHTDLDAGAKVSMESVAVDHQAWVAVGIQSTDGSGDDGSFRPVVLRSTNGTDWASRAPAVPNGMAAAFLNSVTVAGPRTPFPGFVASGVGFVPDAALGGLRKVGIVWSSSDHGQTWKVVSDQSFDFAKRDRWPSQIAADDNTIFVVGKGDSVDRDSLPSGSNVPGTAVYWHLVAGIPGWGVNIDDLAPGRSSRAIAVTANPKGGFVTASQMGDTAGTGNYKVELNSTDNGVDYSQIADFPANLVDSLATNGKVVVFVGRNMSDAGDAWYTSL